MGEVFSRAYLEITETILPAVREQLESYSAGGPASVRETVVTQIWMEQSWAPHRIRDVKGKLVEIISPGWMTGGAGPDFKNAIFRYADQPTQKGDVELHVRSSDWIRHGHHKDPAYDNTCLHVVLYCDSGRDPRVTSAGKPLVEIELGPICSNVINAIRSGAAQQPDKARLQDVTGKCREQFTRLGPDKTRGLLDAAGEARCNLKSRRYTTAIESGKGEEALYEGLCESFGYAAFKKQFSRLAKGAPAGLLRRIRDEIRPTLRPLAMQGALFAVAGLLPNALAVLTYESAEDRKYYGRLNQAWSELSGKYKLTPVLSAGEWPLKGSRPANFPMGRIAGLGNFLAEHLDCDLEAFFGNMLKTFPAQSRSGVGRKWLDQAVSLFPSPQDDYWVWRYVTGGKKLKKPRRLVSADRVALFLINVAIPFYLARARARDDRAEEETLRHIYHGLPVPSTNSTARFMTRRMFKQTTSSRRLLNAARQQGLIQIYTDFCVANPDGCRSCRFAGYLQKLPLADA